jgi:hypothetical protein
VAQAHLSITDPKQGPQNCAFSSDNGADVFSFTLNTLDSQSLTVTDATNSSILGNDVVTVLAKQ